MVVNAGVDGVEPEVLAQRQLDAYNAHDIDAFAAVFAEDVEAYELPTMALLFKGREALRERYGPYFEKKRPAATLVSPRVCVGDFAIDTERVLLADGRVLSAVALYQIEGESIRRMWFIRG